MSSTIGVKLQCPKHGAYELEKGESLSNVGPLLNGPMSDMAASAKSFQPESELLSKKNKYFKIN